MMLVDHYLWFLHLDRRMALDLDLGPLHVHLYGRSVFLMWVTVGILVIGGIAVFASRKRELIEKWAHVDASSRRCRHPDLDGQGTTAAVAAVLAVVAVIEYARLVSLSRVDTGLLLVLAVLYPLAAWLRPSLLALAPILVLAVRCPRCSAATSNMAAGAPCSPRSVRCGSAGPWRTS